MLSDSLISTRIGKALALSFVESHAAIIQKKRRMRGGVIAMQGTCTIYRF